MSKIYKANWYNLSKARWEATSAEIKSVAGDFKGTHESDVEISCGLISDLIKENNLQTHRVIDCGAGIGRVTQYVLLNFFSNIDILERDEKFIKYCRKNFANNKSIANIYHESLESFKYSNNYDLIWIQWCVEELMDDDLTNFLIRSKNALNKNGLIVLKENIISDGRAFWQSIHQKIRSPELFAKIIKDCDLEIIKYYVQKDNLNEILDVGIFVLRATK